MFLSVIPAAPAETRSPSGHTALQRWAFRVAFVYFALDALPDLLIKVPGGPAVLLAYWKVWNPTLVAVGRHVLHMPNPDALRLPTGPVLLGDFAGAYVLMLVFLAIAIIVGAVWTFADQHDSHEPLLRAGLRTYLRYALAFSMMGYGVSKLFHVQFRSLDLVDWMTPFGMLQPRELLWAFMGFSRPYQLFTGAVECVGVALLFWRRTTPLGSLLLSAALGNVLMMDISYGVSVRRIALRLLLMALFLAAPDLRKLTNLFLFPRTVSPSDDEGLFAASTAMRRLAAAAKAVVLLYLVTSVSLSYAQEKKLVDAPRPAIYGLYRVQHVIRDGREEGQDDPRGWKWVAIDGRTFAVQLATTDWERRRAAFDEAKQLMTVSAGPQRRSDLEYSLSGADVVVSGTLDNQPVEIRLQRVPEPRFILNDGEALRWRSLW